MFGHKEIESTGTVVEVQLLDGSSDTYQVVVDVNAADGSTFQSAVEQRLPEQLVPQVGAMVNVRYDSKSHRTELLAGGGLSATSAMPSPGAPVVIQRTSEVIDASHVPGLKEAILSALQSHGVSVPTEGTVTAQNPEVEQAILAALQSHGVSIPGLPALDQAPGQAAAAQPVTASSNVVGAAPTGDTGERLQHLTMLRDSGLLSPEEFETLRQKIQGG